MRVLRREASLLLKVRPLDCVFNTSLVLTFIPPDLAHDLAALDLAVEAKLEVEQHLWDVGMAVPNPLVVDRIEITQDGEVMKEWVSQLWWDLEWVCRCWTLNKT